MDERVKSKRWVTAARFAVAGVIIAFMLAILVRNAADILDAGLAIRPLHLTIAILLLLAYYLAMSGVWYEITRCFDIAVPFWRTVRIWSNSMAGKYLPGKIWLIAGRFYYYRRAGRPATAVTAAIVVDSSVQLVTSCIVFLLCFFALGPAAADLNRSSPVNPVALCAVAVVLLLILVHPSVLQTVVNALARLRRKEAMALSVRAGRVYGTAVCSVGARAIGGLAFFFLVNSVTPIGWPHYFYLTGTMALSGLLGTLAIITPGGIGVREASIAVLLTYLFPEGTAVLLGLVARVWMVVTELLLLGVVNIAVPCKPRK